MDKFVQNTQSTTPTTGCGDEYCPPGIVMDYYDGNTVTGLWNYAQNYSMSDNNWDTSFGPSTPGALNVISGLHRGRHRADPDLGGHPERAGYLERHRRRLDDTATLDPYYDTCSDSNHSHRPARSAC